MPAMEVSRFARRLSAVMAGSGFLTSECRDSIMQLERFRALKAVKVARQSGTSAKRLEDRSRECRVLERAPRPDAVIEVNELSARLRCLKNLHLDAGRKPIANILEELPLRSGPLECVLELELPDPERLTLAGLARM